MIIQNAIVLTDEFLLHRADVKIEGDRIAAIAPEGSLRGEDIIDAEGLYLLPGLVDIHTHGAIGHDFCDADQNANTAMLKFYASRGVTSVVPATMSYSEDILNRIIDAMKPLIGKDNGGAVLRGINMEGPFLSVEKKGAQNPKYLTAPDIMMFHALNERSGGNIRLVDVAPELEGGIDFIKEASKSCAVSLAHTIATYDEAAAAFSAGAGHVTHLFNGMPPYHHREPGVIGAAMDHAKYVEIIADGFHLHPSVVRGVFSGFGADRVCLISDSMRATGMPDGSYTLGGLEVFMRGGRATLADDSLAGSAADLAECCRRAISFGIPLERAVMAASANPAKAVRLYGEIGSITVGKRADFLLWNRELQAEWVMVAGRLIRANQ